MLAFAARAMLVRGAPARARTIASRTGLSPRSSENALLLLERARRELPRGATVVFLDDQKPGNASVNYAVAVGQLPRQHVLTADRIAEAEYVVVLHGGEGGEIIPRGKSISAFSPPQRRGEEGEIVPRRKSISAF